MIKGRMHFAQRFHQRIDFVGEQGVEIGEQAMQFLRGCRDDRHVLPRLALHRFERRHGGRLRGEVHRADIEFGRQRGRMGLAETVIQATKLLLSRQKGLELNKQIPKETVKNVHFVAFDIATFIKEASFFPRSKLLHHHYCYWNE